MTRVILIGASSVILTRRRLGDRLSHLELETASLVHHDIDAARPGIAPRLARRSRESAGALGTT